MTLENFKNVAASEISKMIQLQDLLEKTGAERMYFSVARGGFISFDLSFTERLYDAFVNYDPGKENVMYIAEMDKTRPHYETISEETCDFTCGSCAVKKSARGAGNTNERKMHYTPSL